MIGADTRNSCSHDEPMNDGVTAASLLRGREDYSSGFPRRI